MTYQPLEPTLPAVFGNLNPASEARAQPRMASTTDLPPSATRCSRNHPLSCVLTAASRLHATHHLSMADRPIHCARARGPLLDHSRAQAYVHHLTASRMRVISRHCPAPALTYTLAVQTSAQRGRRLASSSRKVIRFLLSP
ncbi:hypothetical protein BD626DRAFT_637332 [Schizophyllum amplum]|uniref:Uncharacterized protein n=1 Tax=Schizophyllum amplum TaxID=97359 RepID=A0A550BSD4_9AGAR|nr:hypothetical protein BD626DRAFT_637332 [Auriculariopsis ampla]